MGNISLALPGPPDVRHADQVVLFSTRKKLSEQFWPDQDAIHGRATLRTTLFHLCHLLGEDEHRDPLPHLPITYDTPGLDVTSAFDLDLRTLHDAWTAACASRRTVSRMPQDAQQGLLLRLRQAGHPPARGFSLRHAPAFDDWMRFQREYWHVHTSEIFDRLAPLQRDVGDLESAMDTVINTDIMLRRWQAGMTAFRGTKDTPRGVASLAHQVSARPCAGVSRGSVAVVQLRLTHATRAQPVRHHAPTPARMFTGADNSQPLAGP